jgi:hypothetical protein
MKYMPNMFWKKLLSCRIATVFSSRAFSPTGAKLHYKCTWKSICHLVSCYKKTKRRWWRPTVNVYLNFLCHLFFKQDKRKKYFSSSYNQLIWLCRHEVEVKTYFAVTWSWSPRRIGAWWRWQHKAPGSPHRFTAPRQRASHVRMRCRWFARERRR